MITTVVAVMAMAVAKAEVAVVDANNLKPLPGVEVTAYFTQDIGWRAWTEGTQGERIKVTTDGNGRCQVVGNTNCGRIGCWIENPPAGYYRPRGGWEGRYRERSVSGIWQPDDLVATIKLQRIEKPIPLWVRSVRLRVPEGGIGRMDATNSVVAFDLMTGDWLPPYGQGKMADMRMRLRIERWRDDGDFYIMHNRVEFVGEDDGARCLTPDPTDGIRIRDFDGPMAASLMHYLDIRRGLRKRRSGVNWFFERFDEREPERCAAFRIRTRRAADGELVEARYGKIYGDVKFDGDDRRGWTGISFRYYLNPRNLDSNLEWDQQTNLDPSPCGYIPHEP